MSFNHEQYRVYMRSLAERHRYIAHSSSKKRFFELGLAEILTGSITDIAHGEFVMILEGTEGGFEGEDIDHPKRRRETAFIIARPTVVNDFGDVGRAYQESELIGDEMVRKMNEDVELVMAGDADAIAEAACLMDFDPRDVKDQCITGILNGFSGKRYEFNLVHDFDLLNTDPEQWL